MAIMDIVLYPDEPLLRKADPVEDFGPEVEELARDMLDTMFFYEGVGLAAPQVGLSKRLLVLCEPEGEPLCLINPELSVFEGQAEAEEGCLSLPQVYAPVVRAAKIRVRARNERGEEIEFDAEDFLARIIQHENDHFEGHVFPDRLDVLSREGALREWEEKRLQLLAATQGD